MGAHVEEGRGHTSRPLSSGISTGGAQNAVATEQHDFRGGVLKQDAGLVCAEAPRNVCRLVLFLKVPGMVAGWLLVTQCLW